MSQPIEKQHFKTMNEIGRILDGAINPDGKKSYGFALLVFPFNGDAGRMNYISNAEREDMIVAMKEFIANAEGRAHYPEGDSHA